MENIFKINITYILCSIIVACNTTYTLKPAGYCKIDFPKHQYQVFNKAGYPYTFQYPVYANIVQDSSFFNDKPDNPWWINIDFPIFNARIYISYKPIGKNRFAKLLADAYKMTFKQSYKATAIEDSVFRTANGISGTFFHVRGNAATAYQFFITDSTKHFLRGALYFNTTPNEDSLSIVNDFLLQDLKHLTNTFTWGK